MKQVIEACPTFLFQVEWLEVERGIEKFDGYTYAITKPNLLAEIKRRVALGDTLVKYVPRKSRVVKVPMELYKKVLAQSNKCYSTNQ